MLTPANKNKMKRQPANKPGLVQKHSGGWKRHTKFTHVPLGGGVAVRVLDDQVVQVRLLALRHHKLTPVIGWKSQQTLDNLTTKKERIVKSVKDRGYYSALPHPLPTMFSLLCRCLGQDGGEILKKVCGIGMTFMKYGVT